MNQSCETRTCINCGRKFVSCNGMTICAGCNQNQANLAKIQAKQQGIKRGGKS